MYGEPENNGLASLVLHDESIPSTTENRVTLWSVASRYVDGLPAMPGSIFRLNELLSEKPTDLDSVVRVLSSDLSLAAQVVRMANGEAGQDDPPYRLDECTVLLGLSRLRSIVLTTALAAADYDTTSRLSALCQHSSLTSRFALRIAVACAHPEPSKAQIAGLLHDIGELPVFLECQTAAGHLHDILEHCIVGGWLARIWGFPPFLIDVIEHHHDPAKARRDPFLALIAATADELSRMYGVGLQPDPAAHLTLDVAAVLDRHLICLSEERRRVLAERLKVEFSDWAKAPLESGHFKAATEGKWELWQSAL